MQSGDENSTPMVDVTLLCQPKQNLNVKDENNSEEIVSPSHYHRYNPAIHFPPQVICFPKKVRFYTPHMRMRPYYVPHRTRTKSESSDPTNLPIGHDGLDAATNSNASANTSATSSLMETSEPTAMMDVSTFGTCPTGTGNSAARCKNPVVLLTKSRSLEDVRADTSIERSQPSHEMEFVSSRIQKLKVHE